MRNCNGRFPDNLRGDFYGDFHSGWRRRRDEDCYDDCRDKGRERCSDICDEEEEELVSFCFRKLDAESREPVVGAVFTLCNCRRIVAEATSDENGEVCFENLRRRCCYLLVESEPAPGYRRNRCRFCVKVNKRGRVWINGCRPEDFVVLNRAYSAPGEES